jgi:hypothetical protein
LFTIVNMQEAAARQAEFQALQLKPDEVNAR